MGVKLIQLEFNELCPSLLKQFMDKGLLPNFTKLYEKSAVYTTDAGEEDQNLEPWIQWVTVHSGLPYSEHEIFHLGGGRQLDRKLVAEVLSDAGVKVGIMSSMNTNYEKLNGYMVPDPWDKLASAYPEELNVFYKFVSSKVQDASRESKDFDASARNFLSFLFKNGLSFKTILKIIKQVLSEKIDKGLSWRRASVLDHIQYDVFRKLNKKYDVEFATFFCNSVAHYQHYYWRNMQPELFTVPPEKTDHASYDTAIQYGYRSLDDLVGRVMSDYPNAVLIFTTALSQKPWVESTKRTYRPKSFESFVDAIGINKSEIEIKPVMAQQFHIDCSSESVKDQIVKILEGMTLDGERVMSVNVNGNSIFTGCRLEKREVTTKNIKFSHTDKEIPFSELFYMIHSVRSGRHHPDGALWIKDGRHSEAKNKVPLMSIAPTVLSYFKIQKPEYMKANELNF